MKLVTNSTTIKRKVVVQIEGSDVGEAIKLYLKKKKVIKSNSVVLQIDYSKVSDIVVTIEEIIERSQDKLGN